VNDEVISTNVLMRPGSDSVSGSHDIQPALYRTKMAAERNAPKTITSDARKNHIPSFTFSTPSKGHRSANSLGGA